MKAVNYQKKLALFRNFLEEKIFLTQFVKFKKINRGGSSYNFFTQTQDQQFLVKLLPKSDQNRIERLIQILTFFGCNPKFNTPHLIPIKGQISFECGDYIGLVLNYIPGKKISFRDLKAPLFEKIIDNYELFQQLNWTDKQFILPMRTPENLYKDNDHKLEVLKSMPLSFLDRKILKYVIDMNKTFYDTSVIPNSPKAVIHGDASLNNMILDEEGNCVFLDFEMMRSGLIVEDFVEFILSTILPHYIFRVPQKILKSHINMINNKYCFKHQEWLYGIRLYFLYLLNRRIYGTKFLKSKRKDILFILHLKKFHSVIHMLDKLY